MADNRGLDEQNRTPFQGGRNKSQKRTRVVKLTWPEIMQTPQVTIVIGANTYHIYKGLLTQASQHFAEMAEAGWDDHTTQIELDNISDEGFQVVSDWMWSKALSEVLTTRAGGANRDAATNLTLLAYHTAHLLKIPDLQNCLLDNLVGHILPRTYEWTFANLRTLYTYGLYETPLYRFALDSAIWDIMQSARMKQAYEVQLKELEAEPIILRHVAEAALQWRREVRSRPDTALHKYHVRRR